MKAITLLPLFCLTALAGGATLTEPATVFYGKVSNANSGQQLHEGSLVWTIAAPDGSTTELAVPLAEQDDGRFSYFVEVPHHVLAPSLDPVEGTLPVGTVPVEHQHLVITVDGVPTEIDAPGGYRFDLAASARAATYRLDLSVPLPVEDTDGDGMPDWWEEANGLDPAADDSLLDPDGDGVLNLAEFHAGQGPSTDNRGPELLTSELLAYAGATTGVLVRTGDVDSDPEDLQFTLTSVPGAGVLRLRGSEEPLVAGDHFTGADVEGGRLVFEHPDGTPTAETHFSLSVRDEDPAHAASTGEIEVSFFTGTDDPERAALARRGELGRDHGYVVWDLSEIDLAVKLTQPEEGEQSNAIAGGTADDDLSGGAADDEIDGGEDGDRLTGLAGADTFIVFGDDRVTDFTPADGDVLDLRDALVGSSTQLPDYVQFNQNGPDTELRIDSDGDGSGFNDMLITLENFSAGHDGLHTLVGSGNIEAGDLELPALVRLVATVSSAKEFGPVAGEFTLTRFGSADAPLVVLLQAGGSAINGIDYSSLPSSVIIPAGERTLTLPVTPFVDSEVEVSEIVELRVLNSPDYATSATAVAHVTIEDLKPQIQIAALEPIASIEGSDSGFFVITRTGDVGPSVLLRLSVGGTASVGMDYAALPSFLILDSSQTFALLEVAPQAGAIVSGEAESVTLSLLADASYGSTGSGAEIWLVPERLTFDSWSAQNPEAAGRPDALLAYGFGSDRSSRPQLVLDADQHLSLRFHGSPAASDIDYTIEVADKALTWRDATGFEVHQFTPDSAVPGDRAYRAAQPIKDAAFQFMRVRLNR